MCGHCTERAALSARLSMKSAGHATDIDPLLLPVHLQEADDWRHVLAAAAPGDDLVVAIVALCRSWSERLAGAACAPLRTTLGPARHARLGQWLSTLDLPATWTWLCDTEGDPPAVVPLEAARAELDAYLAGWLHVQESVAPAWDEAMLHERLPRVSVALDLVHRDAPGDDRLIALALSSPGAASPFSAIDLWLQRRAMQAAIAYLGPASVLPMLVRGRSGALLAAVLRDGLDRHALRALGEALAQHPDDGTEGTRDLRAAVGLALSA
ncbi:hypothetical protein J2X02_002625 [Pseudoxanthomonas japonensis]|jgi:hypothetical protein|uniref:hypothetical protein n=1 Tax=Pseudoxanthomonas TaxID=83618 RepID=UPI000ABF5399|nr:MULTISPECIES: hypothetical protein [Pseudoxanthomonas]MBL8256780.1 hypothetical protein [Pseudoxanthomonas mexicana]MDR7069774.1 hypothetical protein [Pseudoxanthomonas japonensis]